MKLIDQMGRMPEIDYTPRKIVSLVPSITELLYDLGLKNEIFGITKFCFHPIKKPNKAQIIGGTKKFRMDVIDQIEPDLIFGNKEENYKEGIEILDKKFPVWMSDVNNFDQAMEMIQSVGGLTNKKNEAIELIEQIEKRWNRAKERYNGSVLYLIWNDPIMAIGTNTYIDQVLSLLGFQNIMSSYERYPEVRPDLLGSLNPDYVFLSSEPFPFKERHIAIYKNLFPNSKTILVDGEMFSWYGSRMLLAPDYFKTLNI